MIIELVVHEFLERPFVFFHFRREARQLLTSVPDFGDRGETLHTTGGVLEHVVHHQPDLVADQLSQLTVAGRIWEAFFDRPPLVCEEIQFQEVIEVEKTCPKPVVNVVIVIGDVVRNSRDLRLERRPGSKAERVIGIEFGKRPVGSVNRPVMLGEAFQKVPCQVQTVMLGIGTFEPHDGAQRLGVVIEPAVALHRL